MISSSLSVTFDPPNATKTGFLGFYKKLPKCWIYFCINKPATLYLWAIPTTELWALWAVPKASLTYTLPSLVKLFLKAVTASLEHLTLFPWSSLNFPYSSGWNLTFSQRKISLLALLTWSTILSPTQSSKKVTFLFKRDESWSATGFKLIFAFFFPSGLPRCESKTNDFGLCLAISLIVGRVSK